ncbi:MAG: hypothetical protein K8T25_22035 [Planctomycetia bacterium]|nr:hypothetical protein [Planctomycetia bacterium]
MRVVLSVTKRENGDRLRRLLLGEGLVCEADDVVSPDALPARLASVAPALVVVHCDGSRQAVLSAIRHAHQVTDAPILASGTLGDAEMVREVMRAGARHWLDESRLREELAEAIATLGATNKTAGNEPGTLLAIYSPSGGAGVSNTAINLAVRLAGGQTDRAALVDLKPAPSDLALMLDLEPRHTVDELLLNWERLDRQMIAGSMVAHRSGVSVLAQAGYPSGGGQMPNRLSREGVRQLLTLLRRMYPTSVLDLDHTLDDAQLEAMRHASFVGLVVRSDVPALRRARWALDTAIAQGIPRDRFRLILNRAGRGQITAARIEEALGITVFQSIPDDGRSVLRAINEGRTVAELSRLSRISRSFTSFARNVETLGRSV